jgi:hypothetical protein
MQDGDSNEVEKQRGRAGLGRLILGQLQILGATCTLILLLRAGVQPVTIWCGVITAALTLASRLIFQDGRRGG